MIKFQIYTEQQNNIVKSNEDFKQFLKSSFLYKEYGKQRNEPTNHF